MELIQFVVQTVQFALALIQFAFMGLYSLELAVEVFSPFLQALFLPLQIGAPPFGLSLCFVTDFERLVFGCQYHLLVLCLGFCQQRICPGFG